MGVRVSTGPRAVGEDEQPASDRDAAKAARIRRIRIGPVKVAVSRAGRATVESDSPPATGASRMTTRQTCLDRDAADPLAGARELFSLPDGVIYLDGNSLGALTHTAAARVRETTEREWGRDLISSWNRHGWIQLPQQVGRKIAGLIGAEADEVVAADSVSVNLFKLASAAVRAQGPERRAVIIERGDFPTDLYILQGLAEAMPEIELRVVEPGGAEAALDNRTAVVLL